MERAGLVLVGWVLLAAGCIVETTATTCGDRGQACCGATTCITGLACAGGLCVPAAATAYFSCMPVGNRCADGTTCLQALARGSMTPQGNTCTVICEGGSAMACPGHVPGAARQNVECANLTGIPSTFQCVRLCVTGADCAPYNTQCVQVVSAGGGPLSICVP